MLFNSKAFLLFLPIALICYYLTPKKYRNLTLLAESYIFYAFWDWRFCSLLLLSTTVDFFCARKIQFLNSLNPQNQNSLESDREKIDDLSQQNKIKNKVEAEKRNKQFILQKNLSKKFLWLSIATNLIILGFFKYFNFFADSFSQIAGFFAYDPGFVTLNIVLPVGISFYTFQSMSYTIDVYRKKMPASNNFIDFAAYVSFFPQLVAGPIERASHLLPQFARPKKFQKEYFWEGLSLISLGFLKKVIISDSIAPISDFAFSNWQTAPSLILWEGLIVFSLQIYFDFSGYSDIARGIAKWFGYDLMINFRQPYFSRNITEFWQRWHISLSSWLKDYLYIPLGGNRKGMRRTYINLCITMLLGGLWHGANYTFIIWGALHGLYLSVHKFLLGKQSKELSPNISYVSLWIKCSSTYLLVLLTWLFFRAPDLATALAYLSRLLEFNGEILWLNIGFLFALFLILFVIDIPIYRNKDKPAILNFNKNTQLIYSLLILGISIGLIFKEDVPKPFIYFQF